MSETNLNKNKIDKENLFLDSIKRQKMNPSDIKTRKECPDSPSVEHIAPKVDEYAGNVEINDSGLIGMAIQDEASTPSDLIAATRILTKNAIQVYTDNKNTNDDDDKKRLRSGNINKVLAANSSNKLRSPLAIVNSNTPPTSSCSSSEAQHGSVDLIVHDTSRRQLDESFFLYRKPVQRQTEDVFAKMSDEMILQVLQWLPKKTLIRCTEVCTRFNRLSCDDSLWTRLDMGGRTLKNGALAKIMYRGVVILRLAQGEICDPVFEDAHIDNFHEFEAKLQYLDLSMCVISPHSLKLVLAKCRKIRKLSLEHVRLDSSVVDEIAENTKLEALNLAMCEGLEWMCLRKLMISLTNLQSLNISWTFLTTNSVEVLVKNVNPNLLRLNIAGCRKSMTDVSLTILVSRCPALVELDLSDCTMLTSKSITTLMDLHKLEYLSLSRCYSINVASYLNLNTMTSLLFLDVFGLLSEQATTMLEQSLKKVQINKFIHSAVARPTVGTRRTSVWGLRTRD